MLAKYANDIGTLMIKPETPSKGKHFFNSFKYRQAIPLTSTRTFVVF
jgi:hypothetical protein